MMFGCCIMFYSLSYIAVNGWTYLYSKKIIRMNISLTVNDYVDLTGSNVFKTNVKIYNK